jgi:hypothetical protein
MVNPCGEVEISSEYPLDLSFIRPHGEPIGWMVDNWTVLDDIFYAIREDELTEKFGCEMAAKMIEEGLKRRRMEFLNRYVAGAYAHTHGSPSAVSAIPSP